jgi:hypothetical protein
LQIEGTGPFVARANVAIGFDDINSRVIIHGGWAWTNPPTGPILPAVGETWGIKFGSAIWERYPDGPSRESHGFIMDALRNQLFIFGGATQWYLSPPQTFLNDSWILSLSYGEEEWLKLTEVGSYKPSPRVLP